MILELSIFLLIITIILIHAIWRRRKAGGDLLVPDWSQDVVYLAQFPPSPRVRSISPFSLKLETWLRLANIPYKNIYTRKFSRASHTIPYIELNGKQTADSNQIIARLSAHFQAGVDKELTEEERAMAHVTTSMIENHTAQIGFWWRYGLKMEDFAREALASWKNTFGMRWFMPAGIRLKGRLCVFGRLDPAEAMELSFQDLAALSSILGDQKFFFGEEPSSLDCAVFGHLAQFLYIDIKFPQENYIRTKATNLLHLVERVKSELWPDWEEMCNDFN